MITQSGREARKKKRLNFSNRKLEYSFQHFILTYLCKFPLFRLFTQVSYIYYYYITIYYYVMGCSHTYRLPTIFHLFILCNVRGRRPRRPSWRRRPCRRPPSTPPRGWSRWCPAGSPACRTRSLRPSSPDRTPPAWSDAGDPSDSAESQLQHQRWKIETLLWTEKIIR